MALFQPTNIIPSSFTNGVVDVNSTAQISWQVNGNSAMTAYEITFYENDTDSTIIKSTGRKTVEGGFYGTDRFGNPQMFTWTAGDDNPKTWSEFDSAFTNGQQYKFKITQWYDRVPEGVRQIEFNVFVTREKPMLEIRQINGASVPTGKATITTSILNAKADYSQAQGDSILYIRWELIDLDNGSILDDTGEINTAVRLYEYDGLFNGAHCSLSVYVETTSGVSASATAEINVSYTESPYKYGITAQCNENRNAVALNIETEGSIPATVNSDNDYSYGNGTVIVKPGKTIKWSQVQSSDGLSPMSFSPPYCVAIQFPRMLNPLYTPTSPATLLSNHRIVIEQGSSTITISESQYGFTVSIGPRIVDVSFGNMGLNQDITIFLTSEGVYAKYSGDQADKQIYTPLTYSQGVIKSISISNTYNTLDPYGAIFNYVAIYRGTAETSGLWDRLKVGEYEPSWNDQSIFPTYFIAQFNGTLDAGFSSLPLNYHLFRVEDSTNKLKLIRKSKIGAGNLIDYGVTSGKTYQYYLFVLNDSDRFYASVQTKTIAVRLQNFSLVATRFNEEDGCYHVKQEFVFQGNLIQGDVSNNNSPQFVENFTQYPTRMGSTQNSKSGTLQSLIGYVNSLSEYTESMSVEERLYDLSTSDYILFLRDTKGHIRMVQTSAPIAQQYNLKTMAMQTTISLPWREIGDASECSIVKTEDDY